MGLAIRVLVGFDFGESKSSAHIKEIVGLTGKRRKNKSIGQKYFILCKLYSNGVLLSYDYTF